MDTERAYVCEWCVCVCARVRVHVRLRVRVRVRVRVRSHASVVIPTMIPFRHWWNFTMRPVFIAISWHDYPRFLGF